MHILTNNFEAYNNDLGLDVYKELQTNKTILSPKC